MGYPERTRLTSPRLRLRATADELPAAPIPGSPGPAGEPGGATRGIAALSEGQHQALENLRVQARSLDVARRLAGQVSQDLGFILSVVLANADRLAAVVPESHRWILDELQAAGRAGSATVQQLLGFSGQAELRGATVDLNALVEELAASLRPLLRPGLELLTFGGSPAPLITGDAGAIRRLVTNVVSNARDAIPHSGTIHIETSVAWLGAEHQETHPWVAAGWHVCLTVGDTGVGMDAETAQRLFEPFFSTKPAGRGAGLGMAVVYGLVRQHGGLIQVCSEVGLGTTVKMYFPAAGRGTSGAERHSATGPATQAR